jgi:hypothetical protein
MATDGDDPLGKLLDLPLHGAMDMDELHDYNRRLSHAVGYIMPYGLLPVKRIVVSNRRVIGYYTVCPG